MEMKLAALTFFLLLLFAHLTGDFDTQAGRPLSMFRDGSQAWLGYVLFAALLIVAVLYVTTLVRFDRLGEAATACLAFFLLLVVVATPSSNGFHLLCSLLLLLLMFAYFGLLMARTEKIWLFAHLAVPVALVLVIRFHSYGLWQKSIISYFVLLTAVHHQVLTLPELSPRRYIPTRRRKVYQLEPTREWARSSRTLR
jgi:hypothetical protein